MSAIAAWSPANRTSPVMASRFAWVSGFVTANTFDVLGVRPQLGRVFTAEEDVPNGAPVAVLGYHLWKARYGGDPSILGRTIVLNDVPVQVDRRDARRLPAADRLHRFGGRADAAVAAAADRPEEADAQSRLYGAATARARADGGDGNRRAALDHRRG